MPFIKKMLENELSYIREKKVKKINIFLSYCRYDNKVANDIYDYFKHKRGIELHRDIIKIETWNSIKEYMQSIVNMDYVILIISDSYLKSTNCMYEVLEMMRDRNYREKIFPAVINTEIYNTLKRAEYVKYWQGQCKKLKEVLNEIDTENLGGLDKELKKSLAITSNIAEFLSIVSDMNNPDIDEVSIRIEEKLKQKKLIFDDGANETQKVTDFEHIQLWNQFKNTRERDGVIVSYQAELLAYKLWNEYQDERSGIYLLDLARVRNEQGTVEKLYKILCLSADAKIREAVKAWNKKWRYIDEGL